MFSYVLCRDENGIQLLRNDVASNLHHMRIKRTRVCVRKWSAAKGSTILHAAVDLFQPVAARAPLSYFTHVEIAAVARAQRAQRTHHAGSCETFVFLQQIFQQIYLSENSKNCETKMEKKNRKWNRGQCAAKQCNLREDHTRNRNKSLISLHKSFGAGERETFFSPSFLEVNAQCALLPSMLIAQFVFDVPNGAALFGREIGWKSSNFTCDLGLWITCAWLSRKISEIVEYTLVTHWNKFSLNRLTALCAPEFLMNRTNSRTDAMHFNGSVESFAKLCTMHAIN